MNQLKRSPWTVDEVMDEFGLGPQDLVSVCAACLQASCWLGVSYCDEYKTANVINKTVAELCDLYLEHPDYWVRIRKAEGAQ